MEQGPSSLYFCLIKNILIYQRSSKVGEKVHSKRMNYQVILTHTDRNRSDFNYPCVDSVKQDLRISKCYRMANADKLKSNYNTPNGKSSNATLPHKMSEKHLFLTYWTILFLCFVPVHGFAYIPFSPIVPVPLNDLPRKRSKCIGPCHDPNHLCFGRLSLQNWGEEEGEDDVCAQHVWAQTTFLTD